MAICLFCLASVASPRSTPQFDQGRAGCSKSSLFIPPKIEKKRFSFPSNIEIFSRRFSLKSAKNLRNLSDFAPNQAFEFMNGRSFPKFVRI
jgi:hypothetical protein